MSNSCNWICRHCRGAIGRIVEGKLFIGDVEIIECVATCPTCGKRRRFVEIPAKKAEPKAQSFGGRLVVRSATIL